MVRRRRILWSLLVVAAILLVVAARMLFRPFLADYLHETHLNEVTDTAKKTTVPFQIGERTLLIAPHPDDETLGGAGVIEKAIEAGKQVKVVMMTSGDGYRRCVTENFHIQDPKPADYRRLGEARHLETVQAMKNFGVPEQNVLFLGYPDGGVNGMWELNWDPDHLHLGLNGAVRSPYSFAYEPKAPYCGANVVKNLTAILRDFQPTDVVYPDPNDQHHDHWATGAFVKYVLTQQNYKAKEWTYLVHRGDFPVPWMYKPNLPLDPPYVLTNLDTHWSYVPMSPQEEQRKLNAVKQYPTQIKVMDPFLEAFIRKNDLLGSYTDPKLPTESKTVTFTGADPFPYLLFPDAYGDTVRREMEGGADMTAVGSVLAGPEFSVGLETKAPLHPAVEYYLRMRFFTPRGVNRLDLMVLGGKLINKKLAKNSLDLPKGAKLNQSGNRLWITLSKSVLDEATSFLISADTVMNGEHVDKTAWRLVHVNKTP